MAGYLARSVGLPAIVGYLLAGIAVGPFTPGLVADPGEALQLAEVGVALLMFGVGLHFSVDDLRGVYRIAVPGAVGQIIIATGLGTLAGLAFGWSLRSSFVLGLAISVASTVVLLRALQDRSDVESEAGRVAIGWLIVEDLFTVVALVLLPIMAASADGGPTTAWDTALQIGAALGKATLLAALMLVVGSRVLPWILARVERTDSRELFTLAVLASAIGIAFASAVIFDVSLALGAFLAGAVLSESHLSDRVAADIIPLTDVFTVLFFVSVGMLLDPSIISSHPVEIAIVLAIVVIGKSVAALGLVALLRRPRDVGRLVAVGLAQIGEFSFIVATAGRSLGVLPAEGFQVVVAVALLSITLNPRCSPWRGGAPQRELVCKRVTDRSRWRARASEATTRWTSASHLPIAGPSTSRSVRRPPGRSEHRSWTSMMAQSRKVTMSRRAPPTTHPRSVAGAYRWHERRDTRRRRATRRSSARPLPTRRRGRVAVCWGSAGRGGLLRAVRAATAPRRTWTGVPPAPRRRGQHESPDRTGALRRRPRAIRARPGP